MRHRPIDENFNSPAALQTYQQNFLALREKYLTTPQFVSLETYAKCDAKCNFCPYVSIERIGTKMSDELIAKIVSDIGDLDQSVPLFITLARINEPFLDKRIFDVANAINKVAPHAEFIYFSNGSPLVDDTLDKVEQLPRTFCLSLSFNDHRKSQYEEIMQIPYDRALRRFDAIHERKAKGSLPFWTRVSKVADNSEQDQAFIDFVAERWPLFDVSVYRRATWTGSVLTDSSVVPDAGCHQWFSIGFYADGSDPFCCMDANGKFQHGDIKKQHLLEIYNHDFRKNIREKVTNRKDVAYCKGCASFS